METVTKDSSLIPEEITEKAISELKKYISRQSQQQQETENDESKNRNCLMKMRMMKTINKMNHST